MADEVVAPVAPVEGSTEAATEQKSPEQKAEERKWKLKFGKQEREVSESELVSEAQKGWASDEKFKAAKQIEREVRKALEDGDPEYLIKKKFGKDKLDWAKDVLKDELRRRAMTPEEREHEERKRRVDDLKREEAELTSKQEQAKMDAATRHYEQQYDKEMAEAVTSEGLPKNKYAFSRAIKLASEVVEKGLEPDWKLVVREAKRQIQEELAELIDQVQDGVGFLGEDRARKLAKALAQRGVPQKEVAKVVKQLNDPDQEKPNGMSSDDWFADKRKKWQAK